MMLPQRGIPMNSPEISGTRHIQTEDEQSHHDNTISYPCPPQPGSKHRCTDRKANHSPTVPFSQKIKPQSQRTYPPYPREALHYIIPILMFHHNHTTVFPFLSFTMALVIVSTRPSTTTSLSYSLNPCRKLPVFSSTSTFAI